MSDAADLVLVNGQVRTLDPEREFVNAVAITDGLITAVGADHDVLPLRGPDTRVIDLARACATPGLVDSHTHAFSGALSTRGAVLFGLQTLDEVREALSAEARRCGPGEWVLGWGLDYDVFSATGIHADLIDDVVGDVPAALAFRDLHTMLASTRGLQVAGIDGPRTFEEQAEIVCVEGKPTGELRESGAMALIRSVIPEPTPEQLYSMCAENLQRFAAVGLTGTHMMDGTLEWLELLATLEARGDLCTRVVVPFTIHPDTPEELWAVYAACGKASGRRWRAGVAKFFIDGVIESGTAWLTEPDSEGAGIAPFWPDPARYERAVRFFAERGFQCATHAIGDRGVHHALDAYRQAGAAPGIRHRIEHIELLHDADRGRFAAESVVASTQPEHLFGLERDGSDIFSLRVGRERCARAFRVRDLLDSGAVLALGSDWPVRTQDPRAGMAAARLRRAPGQLERAAYDDQALSGLQALHGYTRGPAIATGDAERLGRITPGFRADITVFADDPVTCDPDDLISLPVCATIVDGELVFSDGLSS
jgi:predicted amidohydrolase YtcJ